MGKKEKRGKKTSGKGLAKTAERTEKKLRSKVAKASNEDDIESMVKAIEEEERKRLAVKEHLLQSHPSHRANLSMNSLTDTPDLVLFGGELFNGQKTVMYNDLILFNTKRREWSRIQSPAGPSPRCAHQGVLVAQGGGQLWLFGGEFASASESQFHHFKDLWCFHFQTKRWEKISESGGPSSRSGHRMVLLKRHLVVFGGFHDNLREAKYFNDLHAFDLDNRKWKKLETKGVGPCPRSACNMFALADNRICVFAGYYKEKGKKESEKGVTCSDMFVLQPEKNDETFTKWRWQTVKQTGLKPSLRTGMAVATAPSADKAFFFGGVHDIKDEDEELEGCFFNDLYSLHIEQERATWRKIELSGRKIESQSGAKHGEREEKQDDCQDRKENDDDGKEVSVEGKAPSTVTVEAGAFTITSTVGLKEDIQGKKEKEGMESNRETFVPCPRFNALMTVKQGRLYLYGGMIEIEDKQITLNDFYSIDIHKFDYWDTIVESDIKTMEWIDTDTSDDDDESDDDDDDEEDGNEHREERDSKEE